MAGKLSSVFLVLALVLPAFSALGYETLLVPTEVRHSDPSRAYEGYSLFPSRGITYLIDMEGRVVHTWNRGSNPKLLDNGNLLDRGSYDILGGRGFQEVDWNSTVVWQYTETRKDYNPHHDFNRIFNPRLNAYTTLYIVNRNITQAQALAAGCDPATGPYYGAQMDAVVEVDMNGTVVWEWWFFDHVVQDIDPSKANYVGAGKNISDYPGRMNLNMPGKPLRTDWLHCNAIDYNQDLDQIAISSLHGEFYVVDHGGTFVPGDTNASIALAKGPAGDFLYRFGDPARYGRGDPPSILEDWTTSTTGHKQLGGAHDIQWIREGLPGAGHFLLFNNAQFLYEKTAQSYVVEINPYLDAGGRDTGRYVDPPSAGYRLQEPADPDNSSKQPRLISNQTVWSFGSKSNQDLYDQIGCSVQRLPNGNTFISSCAHGRLLEVTSSGDIVWEYANPDSIWGVRKVRPESLPMVSAMFRAYRLGPDHPALAGRTLKPGDPLTGPVQGPDFRPPEGATETFYLDAASSYGGYTLFAANGTTYLIDLEGRMVNTWALGANPRLLDNGTLLDASSADIRDLGSIVMAGWDGTVLWKHTETRPGYLIHHDFLAAKNRELDAPTVMYLASRPVTHAEAVAAGCDPADGPYYGARTDGVVEVDMSGAVVWEWWFLDHGIQDVDPAGANFVGAGRNISAYPGRINLNLPGRPLGERWLDCNSIDFNGKLDQVVVNSELGEFYIIDHGSTFVPGDPASSRALAAGPAGDFLYRFGDPARYGQGAPPSVNKDWTTHTTGVKQIGGSNNVHWIAPGLPGEGNLLVFNNGQYYFERSAQSYVFEVDPFRNRNGVHTTAYVNPPDAGYFRLGMPYSTIKEPKQISNQVVWNYFSKTNLAFFSHLGSSAQRLPNGNLMVCSMSEGHLFEVTSNGTPVWEYVSPVTAAGPVQNVYDSRPMTNPVYRALRYGADHPALRGRDLSSGGTITGAAPHYMTPGMIDGTATGPALFGAERTPFRPTPSESVAVTVKVQTTAALASIRLVYSVSRPGRALQEWMAFRETMSAFPSGAWTGAGADNPWTVSVTDPAHALQGALANLGEGNPCGLELRNGTDSLNDTMVETALGIDTRGDAGRVEFWLRADGLGSGGGWTFQLDGGSGFETRLSELLGQSHGWQFYRCELRESELVGALGMRFQFRGGDPGASVRLDQIYVNVSSAGAPAEEFELAMLDDGDHGDGKAGDGRFGARIPAFPERTRVSYYIAAAASGGAAARDPAGAPAIARGYTVAEGAAALTFGPLPDTGQAGDFTSSHGEDSDYTINAPSFTDNGDGTITDAVTGLLWQKGDGGETTWEKARSYADGLVLGGYDDWRLPSSHELFCLLDLGRHGPALDTGYFTNTGAEHYWAADALAGDAGMAWAVDGGGGMAPHRKTGDLGAGGRFHVRCVRDGNTATSPSGDFTDNGDGTATSAATGLVWQGSEAPSDMTWEGALSYCEGLVLGGRDDWRLPNAKELRSLTNDTRSGPSLNSSAFPGARPSEYWASTTVVGDPAKAWSVDFGHGAAAGSAKAQRLLVRAVRGGFNGTGVPAALPEMVGVPGGRFDMGDHSGLGGGAQGNASDEEPIHDVTLDGFSIGRFEVTNAQYCEFLNDEIGRGAISVLAGGVFPAGKTTPLCGIGPQDPSSRIAWDGQRFSVLDGRMAHPATGIRWEGAAAYCNWLGAKEGFAPIYDIATGGWNRTAAGFRLPTEAEWEWAALGGQNGSYPVFPWGDVADAGRANWPDSSDPYEAGSPPWTTPAGFYDGSLRRKAGLGWPAGQAAYQTGNGSNPLGLSDLAGNVREWVNDLYNSEYYSFCPHVNPPGPENGTLMPDGKAHHAARGGGWLQGLFGQSRISDRSSGYSAGAPGAPYSDVGFRVALVEAREPNSLVAPGSAPERLAGEDRPFDGPAADAAGNLYFTEPERDLIHVWSIGGNLSVFRNGTGVATGLAFDRGRNLVACEAGGRLVARFDPARPAENATVLSAQYDGKAFNGPDDLWLDPEGGIYFTDPAPGNGTLSQDGEHVYYLAPGATAPIPVARDLARPGGLAGTDDGRTLYLSDIGAGRTYRYSVLPDGNLSGKELFAPHGSAGITLDDRGNVYLSERSVLVFGAGGNRLAEIAVPARPTGLEFGGGDRHTLFITTEKGLYGVRMAAGGTYRFDPLPDLIPPVFINEIKWEPENGTGRPVFWVELFNNGTEPVDLGGMHLTNELARPAAWTLPANTTMAARGFLVVWAGKGPARGPLHADFELDAAGGVVALFSPNGTLVDSMAFGPMPANASYGRYPDGSDKFIFMRDHPSPGSPNVPDDPDDVDPGTGKPPAGTPRTIPIGVPEVRYALPALIAVIAAVGAGLFLYDRRLDRKGPGSRA